MRIKLTVDSGQWTVIATIAVLVLSMQVVAEERIRIVSYNVENFFDVKKDSVKDDASFTPDGDHYWSYTKYKKKAANIAKAIIAVGEWQGAAIVGLCEVENDYVLTTLVKYSPLEQKGYKYLHYESPDPRGIDVAMLYDPRQVSVTESHPIEIKYRPDAFSTRDVLYAKFLLRESDTLHLFLCHTPSRRGGVEESSWKREFVMGIVRQKVDSIRQNPDANVIIMGDFNDYPDCKSMCESLGARKPDAVVQDTTLYNMFWKYQAEGKGSYKYQGEWNMLDQIIVSGNMLQPGSSVHTSQADAHIFDADFLLEDDTKFFGTKPLRTYNGRRYIGGYSDHLPVYIDFHLKSEK